MKYLVSYDLNNPGQNYDCLIACIQAYGSCANINRSCWAIETHQTAAQIRNNLTQHLDSNDTLFVCEIQSWASLNLKKNTAALLHN